MANQVAARLAGDDYQHLFGWLQILELRMPDSDVRAVIIEDPDAAHVDDVTTLYGPTSQRSDEFVQVKYHMNQGGSYSTDYLLEKKTVASRSLLEKFFTTWKVLGAGSRPIELRLISNWSWDSNDPVRAFIRGRDNSLAEEFLTASPRTKIGRIRDQWRNHLSADECELAAFVRALRLRLGFDCYDEIAKRVSERMRFLKLKFDEPALVVAVGIVRELVKSGRTELTRDKLDDLLSRYDLALQPGQEAATVIYLTTVTTQQFEIPPDLHLDWRHYFAGDVMKKGHAVIDARSWNEQMLLELRRLEADLNGQQAPRLIKARGLARLSAWFAFGHTFSEVARYTIEIDQQGKLWRTDATRTAMEARETGREDVAGGATLTVAVGISITGVLERDVRAYVTATAAASKILFLQPNCEVGRDVFTSEGDVVGFATTAKERIRRFVKEHGATRLLLFYFGPLSGACFIGHQLNAVAREIQIMEDQQPRYAPSFLLT